jgi:hypothetical protein
MPESAALGGSDYWNGWGKQQHADALAVLPQLVHLDRLRLQHEHGCIRGVTRCAGRARTSAAATARRTSTASRSVGGRYGRPAERGKRATPACPRWVATVWGVRAELSLGYVVPALVALLPASSAYAAHNLWRY